MQRIDTFAHLYSPDLTFNPPSQIKIVKNVIVGHIRAFFPSPEASVSTQSSRNYARHPKWYGGNGMT